MAWVKLDDHMPENSKVIGLGPAVKWTHIEALCYCARNLTDGLVLAVAARKMGTATAIRQLTDAGLWERDGVNFRIHDYLEYNPSREQVLAEREQVKRRVERFRNGGRNAVTNAAPLPHPVPHPLQEPEVPDQNPPTPRKRVEPVDEDFIRSLVEEWAGTFPESRVRDEVERALNSVASRKWLDQRRGVKGWLRRSKQFDDRDAAKRAPTPLRTGYLAPVPAGQLRPGEYATFEEALAASQAAARSQA